jgi:hypothetical protein
MKNTRRTFTHYKKTPSNERFRGFEDARTTRPYCADYDGWTQIQQFNYERGRHLHAILAAAAGRNPLDGRPLPRWDGIKLFSNYIKFQLGMAFYNKVKPSLAEYSAYWQRANAA